MLSLPSASRVRVTPAQRANTNTGLAEPRDRVTDLRRSGGIKFPLTALAATRELQFAPLPWRRTSPRSCAAAGEDGAQGR
jgi:hypothetical protein